MGLGRDEPGEPAERRIAAAIDVGSNSTHLVVAEVEGDGRLTVLADASTFAALGDLVARDGRLGAASCATLAETLGGFADEARRLGAGSITIVGTEPVRMATDRADLADAVQRSTGLPLAVLSHEDEAHLMVIGVQAGRPATGDLLVVDIGGGSTELCLVGRSGVRYAGGLKVGSAGLTRRHATTDPPTPDAMDSMAAEARDVLGGAPDARSATIVAVGGTASNLVRLVPGSLKDDAMTRSSLREARALLLSMSADRAVRTYGFKPTRARLLPAGAAILEALFDRYGVERIRTADVGLREGVIHAVAHAGDAWRERLPQLATGWRY